MPGIGANQPSEEQGQGSTSSPYRQITIIKLGGKTDQIIDSILGGFFT
jgi:hypothetical protein